MFWNSTYTPQRSFITVFHFYCLAGIIPSLAGRAIWAQRHLLRVQWNICFHFSAVCRGFTSGPCSCILLSLLLLCRKLSEKSTHRGRLINTWCYQATCSVLSQAHAMYKYIFCFQWKLSYMSTWYFLNMCEWLISTWHVNPVLWGSLPWTQEEIIHPSIRHKHSSLRRDYDTWYKFYITILNLIRKLHFCNESPLMKTIQTYLIILTDCIYDSALLLR